MANARRAKNAGTAGAARPVRTPASGPELVTVLFQLQLAVKLFHWQTRDYAAHVESGKLFDNIIELTDEIIEQSSSREIDQRQGVVHGYVSGFFHDMNGSRLAIEFDAFPGIVDVSMVFGELSGCVKFDYCTSAILICCNCLINQFHTRPTCAL